MNNIKNLNNTKKRENELHFLHKAMELTSCDLQWYLRRLDIMLE